MLMMATALAGYWLGRRAEQKMQERRDRETFQKTTGAELLFASPLIKLVEGRGVFHYEGLCNAADRTNVYNYDARVTVRRVCESCRRVARRAAEAEMQERALGR